MQAPSEVPWATCEALAEQVAERSEAWREQSEPVTTRMSTEQVQAIYAVGAVVVSILAALRLSKCTRIKCGCIEIDRPYAGHQASPHEPDSEPDSEPDEPEPRAQA